MKKIFSIGEINKNDLEVTFGSFDGVHLGHRFLIDHFEKGALAKQRKSVLVTFTPYPKKVISNAKPSWVTSYDDREKLLKESKIDFLLELKFNEEMKDLSAEEFLDKFIFVNDNIKRLVLGHDFRLGTKCDKSISIEEISKKRSIECMRLPPFLLNNKRVSSSLIRESLELGDIETVNNYLGRPYSISGEVIRGEARGRMIGVPTVNLKYLSELQTPKSGVYATQINIDGEVFDSVTNIGVNPTFTKKNILKIETNIFNFDREIYGDTVILLFYKRIRNEIKFSGVGPLVKQISKDKDDVKKYFKDA